MAKLSETDLISAIEAEEQTAINWADGPLAEARAEALRRYNSEPYGNEKVGRSSIVSSDVRDAVEGVMPSLARVFLSGDEIGKFEPIDPSDAGYEIESEVVNWYITTKNDGFAIIYCALKDALLLANSYIKAWWRKREDVEVERYDNLSDEELGILMQDEDVKIVEHTPHTEQAEGEAMPAIDPMTGQPVPAPMLHDVKVERVKADEYVQICAVPTDELLVSANHRETSLVNADFVQHRRELSIGELRELGYKVDDSIADDTDDSDRAQSLARDRYQEYTQDTDDASAIDPTRRRVVLRETWIRLGDGKGKQTLWRVCLVGKSVLHKEEADFIPIAAFSPILYPHSHVGISYYDLISDLAELKTVITRQYLDNLYLQNNVRTAVDLNKVNMDDLLVSTPGGVVRIEGDPAGAIMPLVTPDVGQSALNALEMLESVKENRTGVARVNQGTLDPNALNRTATGASLMMSAGQSRLELIARCLAGGIRDLFLIVHAIALKHSTKPLQIRLKNNWIPVNPREWVRRTDFSVSVGLGTGAPEQQIAKMQMMAQYIAQLMPMGLVSRENLYEFAKEFLKVAGYRSADKFLTQPQQGQQPPQQMPPEVQAAQVQVQGLAQVEQIKQQGKAQEIQVKAQLDSNKAQQDAQLARQAASDQIQVEQYKIDKQMELERFKAELDANTRLAIAELQVRSSAAIASMRQIDGNPNNGEFAQ